MYKLYEALHKKAYTLQEFLAILLNFWITVSVIGVYERLTNTILVTSFYSMPKWFVLAVCTFCFLWSCFCFVNRRMKSSGLLVNIGFYVWIALTSLITNPFSIIAGTYIIIAFRYIVMYIAIKVQEGHDVANRYTK